jgi:DNA-binding IclR family transcriptional regulator
MILLAVAAILGEGLARAGIAAEYGSLGRPVEPSLLPRCNIASIAHATGLNRESTRRKVNDLIQRGLLERRADGTIGFRTGVLQEDWARKMVRRQLIEAAALANRLARLGVLVEG